MLSLFCYIDSAIYFFKKIRSSDDNAEINGLENVLKAIKISELNEWLMGKIMFIEV